MRNFEPLASQLHKVSQRLARQVGFTTLATLAAVVTIVAIWGQVRPPSDTQSEVLPLSSDAYVPGEFLVKFKPGMALDAIREFNRDLGVEEIEYLEQIGVFRLKILPGFSVLQMVQRYQNHPQIEYAAPNYVVEAIPTPDPKSLSPQGVLP